VSTAVEDPNMQSTRAASAPIQFKYEKGSARLTIPLKVRRTEEEETIMVIGRLQTLNDPMRSVTLYPQYSYGLYPSNCTSVAN
jgi:hypothetical protein